MKIETRPIAASEELYLHQRDLEHFLNIARYYNYGDITRTFIINNIKIPYCFIANRISIKNPYNMYSVRKIDTGLAVDAYFDTQFRSSYHFTEKLINQFIDIGKGNKAIVYNFSKHLLIQVFN